MGIIFARISRHRNLNIHRNSTGFHSICLCVLPWSISLDETNVRKVVTSNPQGTSFTRGWFEWRFTRAGRCDWRCALGMRLRTCLLARSRARACALCNAFLYISLRAIRDARVFVSLGETIYANTSELIRVFHRCTRPCTHEQVASGEVHSILYSELH